MLPVVEPPKRRLIEELETLVHKVCVEGVKAASVSLSYVSLLIGFYVGGNRPVVTHRGQLANFWTASLSHLDRGHFLGNVGSIGSLAVYYEAAYAEHWSCVFHIVAASFAQAAWSRSPIAGASGVFFAFFGAICVKGVSEWRSRRGYSVLHGAVCAASAVAAAMGRLGVKRACDSCHFVGLGVGISAAIARESFRSRRRVLCGASSAVFATIMGLPLLAEMNTDCCSSRQNG